MKIRFFSILCVTTLLTPIYLLNAQEAVPDDYESVAVDAADAYEFAKACLPSVSVASFNHSVRSTAEKQISIAAPSDKTKPMLGIARGRAYCIRMSAHKYPILPLTFFDETVYFPDMQSDEVRKLRSDLSRQLAATGVATALVLTDDESAFRIGFVFNNNTPNRVYYHGGLLKKGEYDEKDFRPIYRTKGAMTISARGPPSEHFKSIF